MPRPMNGTPAMRSAAWSSVAGASSPGRGRNAAIQVKERLALRRLLVRGTVVSVAALLSIGAVALTLRRFWLDVATLHSPGPWAFAGTLGLAVSALLVRLAWYEWGREPELVASNGEVGQARHGLARRADDRVIESLACVFVVLGGVTLASLSASAVWGPLTLLVVVVEEAWAWRLRGGRQHPGRDGDHAETHPSAAHEPIVPRADELAEAAEASVSANLERGADRNDDAFDEPYEEDGADVEESEEQEEAWTPPGLTQQITRGVDPERGEYVIGVLYVEILAGQRSETFHVAFCPPLTGVPKIEVVPIEGPECTVTVGQAESFGARFELRLGRVVAESSQVAFQFEARVSNAR